MKTEWWVSLPHLCFTVGPLIQMLHAKDALNMNVEKRNLKMKFENGVFLVVMFEILNNAAP